MEQKRIPIPRSAGENASGFFKIKDDNVAPFLEAGDYVLVQEKTSAKEYRAGELCVVLFEDEPAVRQVWWKDGTLMLWDFKGRVDAYPLAALGEFDEVKFLGAIIGLYRPMPYTPPMGKSKADA